MVLSSDELEILSYLKSWNGKFVTVIEICRSASGRQKFKESPHWAKPLMSRLVELKLAEVNERGHYRAISEEEAQGAVVGDDYFPAPSEPEDAGPPPPMLPPPKPAAPKRKRWISPQYTAILKDSGLKPDQ
jgi:hypothetical protein